MVRLATASSPMEARIIAARLGSEGIVWEFRGSVDGPLAMGPVEILVDADGLESARELLLVDDLESSFSDSAGADAHVTTARDVLWAALALIALLLFAIARMAARV
jgi:hypothetical protein